MIKFNLKTSNFCFLLLDGVQYIYKTSYLRITTTQNLYLLRRIFENIQI